MKKIIILFLLAIQFVSAQTKIDTLVFNKVNEYRSSMNLNPLKWDTTSFKASNIHTKYLVKTGRVGHSEDSLKEPKDRMKVFDKKGKWTTICEVALSTKPRNIKDTDIDINEKLATDVVNGWKSSKDHNEILLDKNCSFSGVSCLLIIIPSGINGINNYRVISTMLIVGGTYRKL
jgi:uncharacterized protein YkwD